MPAHPSHSPLLAAGALMLAASCANIIGVDGDFHEVSDGSGPTSSSTSSTGGATSTATTGGMGGMGGGGGVGGMPGPCGNNALDIGEQCDDGNVVSTDGCSNGCQLEGPADMCPTGANISLGPEGIWILDDGSGRNSSTRTPCGGLSAPDLIYQITPSQDGTLVFDMVASYAQSILALRPDCNSSTADRCEEGSMMASTTYPVLQGVPFHVVVTGGSGNAGQFTLHIYFQ
jgi:cysteine-rich repeat protein